MNDNYNKEQSNSQCNQIAEWLQQGYSITSLEALNRFGCMRLASRIHDLRERGMDITACKIKTNTGKWVTEYVLTRQY